VKKGEGKKQPDIGILLRIPVECYEAELCRRRLRNYIRAAWPIIEPTTPFIPGWHIDAIADHLEAVSKGAIRRLIILIPPRHAKSTIVSVMWPTWSWIDHPSTRWLTASYAAALSTRDSVRSRRLIDSAWYQARWGDVFTMTSDQNEKQRYENDKTGVRIATSVGGAVTGEGGDFIVVDDPHSVLEAESDQVREGRLTWFDQVMSTRLNSAKEGRIVVIQQRIHERDLAGHLEEQGGWDVLCLPTEYEPTTRLTAIGWKDPRTEPGELLCPARFGPEEVSRAKRTLGSRGFAAQHQQQPAPAHGSIVKIPWFRYWRPATMALGPIPVKQMNGEIAMVEAVELPARADIVIQSWDMAFQGTDESDFVVGQLWAAKGADFFLLDQRRDRLDFTATLAEVRAFSARHPEARLKLVEAAANGPAVISTLMHEIPGIVPVRAQGSKASRLSAVAPYIEAGNVYLPHPGIAPWVDGFLEEIRVFGKGVHDDQVDAMSQALGRLAARVGRERGERPHGAMDQSEQALLMALEGKITRLRALLVAGGLPERTVQDAEARYGEDRRGFLGWLREVRDEFTQRGRLRRAGLVEDLEDEAGDDEEEHRPG